MDTAVNMDETTVENPFTDVLSENTYLLKLLAEPEGQCRKLSAALEEEHGEVSILEAEPRTADERLAEARALYKKTCADLADAKEQAQALKQELDHAQSTNEWLRRELDMAYAKIEMVELIFGANRCGGCH